MGSIGLLLASAHMVGDFVTQNEWMAANKLCDWRARLVHVAVYTAGFVPVVLLTPLTWEHRGIFLALLFVTHFVTDGRRWASGDKWPPKPILVDQSIHVATLGALAMLFGL
jgi:hypothetical protein